MLYGDSAFRVLRSKPDAAISHLESEPVYYKHTKLMRLTDSRKAWPELRDLQSKALNKAVLRVTQDKIVHNKTGVLWAAKDGRKADWQQLAQTNLRPNNLINHLNSTFGDQFDKIGQPIAEEDFDLVEFSVAPDKQYKTIFKTTTKQSKETREVDPEKIISVELSAGNKFGRWKYNNNDHLLYYLSNQNKVLGFTCLIDTV
jgi:hypothetical protein